MVGKRRQSNPDCPSETFWQDSEHEYAGAFFQCKVNGLISSLIRKGSKNIKMQFEFLLSGKTIRSRINEEMVFNQLGGSEYAVWSLLLTSGYLKIVEDHGKEYELSLTNYEVKQTFEDMVRDWFDESGGDYNDFVKALLRGDRKEMNVWANASGAGDRKRTHPQIWFCVQGKRSIDRVIFKNLNLEERQRKL